MQTNTGLCGCLSYWFQLPNWAFSVPFSAKDSLTTEMGLESLGHPLTAVSPSIEFGGGSSRVCVGGAFWLSRKGTLRKHCQAVSAHPLPSRGEWGAVVTIQRGMVACVGTCLTYIPINTTPWLSTVSFLNPTYIVKIFTFNEMVVPVSTLWALLILSHWIMLFIPICQYRTWPTGIIGYRK